MNSAAVEEVSPTHTSGRIPGEAGAWVFIIGDMFIFTALFGVIMYYRSQHLELFAESQQELNQAFGLINTLVLLTGSILVVRASAAFTAARRLVASRLLGAAIACGLCFVAIKSLEYGSLIQDGWWIHSNEFFMLFFVITGAHLLHLLLGIGALLLLRKQVRRDASTRRNLALFESGACYWHLVDLLWLMLFPMFYMVNVL